MSEHQNQGANNAPKPAQVIDITDPKVLMGILGNMFQQQTEANEINRKLLEIKMREEEARLAKDAEALAKWERARNSALTELKNFTTNQQRRWASCPHQDQKQGWTVWPISNYPDGRLRGYCTGCGMPIEPEHYEFDAHGRKTLVKEHPLYKIVLQRDHQIYAGFMPVMSY